MAAANTSVAREYHAGLAAMLGSQAAFAAQQEYKAEETILETRRGFFEVYGGTDGATGRACVTHELGNPGISSPIRPSSWCPAAIPTMPSPRPLPMRRKRQISCRKPSRASRCRDPVSRRAGPLHPIDLIGMAHSPAYFLAAGAADRDFSWLMRRPRKSANRSSIG
jgi:hypothetical protein